VPTLTCGLFRSKFSLAMSFSYWQLGDYRWFTGVLL